MFQLFNVLIASAIGIVFVVATGRQYNNVLSVFLFGYGLVSYIVSLSCTVRRLHDTGKSGWWYLISFVPLIGAIILLVFMCTDSEPGRNQYGPNPKLPGYANVVI